MSIQKYISLIEGSHPCKTPGADDMIAVEQADRGGHPTCPPSRPLDGMGGNGAERAEDLMHDALEGVVATLVDEIDADASLRWTAPQQTDPLEESATLTEKSAYGSAWIVIVCDETGDILLGKRAKSANNPGQWNLFGGGIDQGENAIDTAVRELWEEAGLRVDPTNLRRIAASPRGMTIFELSADRRQVVRSLRTNKKEIEKVKWFALTDLPANLHKSTRALLHTRRVDADTDAAFADPKAAQAQPDARGMLEGEAIAEARGSEDVFAEALWWVTRWISGSIHDPDWDWGEPCALDLDRAMEIVADRIGNTNSVGKTLARYIRVTPKEARFIQKHKVLPKHNWTFQSFTEHPQLAQEIGEEIHSDSNDGKVGLILTVRPPPNLVMFGMSDLKRAKRRTNVSQAYTSLDHWHHQGEVIVRMSQPLPVESIKVIK